jgi:glycosyltransferase involved in cell wall biosynthesis
VLATCFDQAPFVVECLESIKGQTYPEIELVVVDDCSMDRSVEVIREWLARTDTPCTLVVHERNHGVCRARNEALAHAHGAYVAGIDMDNAFLPDTLTALVERLETSPPNVGVVYGDADRMDEHGAQLGETFLEHLGRDRRPDGDVYEALLEANFVPDGAALVRRDCFEAVGPYDESLVYEDWDMWLRIARHYEFAVAPRICARYRVHERSLSHTLAKRDGGALWWESDLRMFLKHVGSSPARDAVLWDRIARAAYRLNLPEQLEYARANLRARATPRAVALYALCRASVPYRWVAPVTRTVRRALGRVR